MLRLLRELLARGGVASLALVFALAFAGYALANSLAAQAVSALAQNVGELERGYPLAFHIGNTRIDYSIVLQAALSLLLVGFGLFATWRLTRSDVRECPECRSEIPANASVCRFCTVELTGRET